MTRPRVAWQRRSDMTWPRNERARASRPVAARNELSRPGPPQGSRPMRFLVYPNGVRFFFFFCLRFLSTLISIFILTHNFTLAGTHSQSCSESHSLSLTFSLFIALTLILTFTCTHPHAVGEKATQQWSSRVSLSERPISKAVGEWHCDWL